MDSSALVSNVTFLISMYAGQAEEISGKNGSSSNNSSSSNTSNSSTIAATTVASTSNIESGYNAMLWAEDSADYIMDEETVTSLTRTFTIIRLCLAIFGVVANCVTCYVLTNKKLWSPTSLLLMTLVAYDAVFLLAMMPFCMIDANFDQNTFFIIMRIFYPLRHMAQTGSIYTTVTLTVERYLIVLRPFKSRAFYTFGKIKRFVIVIFIFSILFNIPRCFFYKFANAFGQMQFPNMTSFPNQTDYGYGAEYASYSSPPVVIAAEESSSSSSSSSSYSPEVTATEEPMDDIYSSHNTEQAKRTAFYIWLYTIVYEVYLNGVFFYLLPLVLIPILNFQLLLVIKKRRRETRLISLKKEHRHMNTKATDREDDLTRIVLGITFCFFVCCLAPAIYKVTRIAKVPPTTEVFLMIMSDTMLCINASTDFFFYCLVGAKFRNTFLQMFCSKPACSANRSPIIHSRHSDTFYHTV